jgi:Tfp pilus assembly protein PilX
MPMDRASGRPRRPNRRPRAAEPPVERTFMNDPTVRPSRDASSAKPPRERGIALVVALLVLLVISLICAALMMSVQVETKISGRDDRRSQALSLAEAGVSEAISRIRSGEVPDTLNPRMTSQIFLISGGNVPVLGGDSTALATAQPAGNWLTYSTAGRGDQVLTVTYKTDTARARIYRYDQAKNPPVQTTTGQPIFVITSTGRKGSDSRTVVTEVIRKPFIPDIKGAVVADVDVRFGGNNAICGYNHSALVPIWYGQNGRGGLNSCVPYEIGAGNILGVWSAGTVTLGGGTQVDGQPPSAGGQVGFYSGPWDALGMPQADFYTMVGAPQALVPATLNGIVYLDNDGVPQNQSGAWGVSSTNGQGLLYVDGDLNITGPFSWKGLIYAEGNLACSGQIWILGSLIARGNAGVKLTGGSTVLFSTDEIQLALSKFAGQYVTLSWREK